MNSLLLVLALAAAPAPTDNAAKAKETFSAGKKLFGEGKYAEAVKRFEEAYSLKPHPLIFFNIGKCYELIGDAGKAMKAYREYLRALPDANDRQAVTDSVTNLERKLRDRGLQQITVFADPPAAKIEIDGKDVGASPATIELSGGSHKLVVKAQGFQTVERPFTMSLTRASEMTINLQAAGAATATT